VTLSLGGMRPDRCRFGTIGNSAGETPGRVQIARFWCGRLARLLRGSPQVTDEDLQGAERGAS